MNEDKKITNRDLIKYFLYKHPKTALIGLVLLLVSTICIWLSILQVMFESSTIIPHHPIVLIYGLFFYFLLFIWFMIIGVISLIYANEYKIQLGKINSVHKFKTIEKLLLGVIVPLMIIYQIVYNQLVSYFPNYTSLLNFDYNLLFLVLITVFSGIYIMKLTPWYLQSAWSKKRNI